MVNIEFLGSHPLTDKELYVLEIENLSRWPARLSSISEHFGLLLLCDAVEIADETILSAARKALSQGLAFLLTWGKDSGRVHDLFDRVSIEGGKVERDTIVLSVWNDPKKPIEKALWDFVYTFRPADAYGETCRSWITASVSNGEYAARARRWLKRRRLRRTYGGDQKRLH